MTFHSLRSYFKVISALSKQLLPYATLPLKDIFFVFSQIHCPPFSHPATASLTFPLNVNVQFSQASFATPNSFGSF